MAKKMNPIDPINVGFNPSELRRKIQKQLEEDFWKEETTATEELAKDNERLKQIITDLQRVQKDQQEKIADMQERINGYLEEIRIYEHEHRTLRQIIIDALKKEYP